MDLRLFEAIKGNKVVEFLDLVRDNNNILDQITVSESLSMLHLASRFGHVELATEIIKLWPVMVEAENEKMETPFHEACGQGHVEVLKLLLETDPWACYKLNNKNESPFFIASSCGHLNVVKHLLLSNSIRDTVR